MAKKKFTGGKDTITLVAGHSVIMSHLPEALTLEKVSNKLSTNPSQEVESFGLFDNSTPNYSTYYPEVTEEDLKPKDSDFIEPVFRMLSNTVVQHRYNPIEFPEDVLKASMPKLVGMSVNIDHETAVGNAVGSVKSVEWQDSYTVNGLKVPAGINARLKIDGKSNPRIARGIMMEPPSIHSNSVTVMFAWKPSHTGLSESEFYNKLGTFDEKGKMVRKVATEIFFYSETSLVGLGADPFAQKIGNNGKIVNPGLTKSRKPIDQKHLSADNEDVTAAVVFDYKNINKETGTFTAASFEIEDEEQNNNNMEELLRLLETIFGFEAESLTEENHEEKLKAIGVELTALKEKEDFDPEKLEVEGLIGVTAIGQAIKEANALKAQIPENETMENIVKMSGISTELLTELRQDTVRLYKLSLGEKTEDENIISLINTSDYAALKALNKQYDNITEEEFDFSCKKCGSTEVTRAKAQPSGGGNNDDEHVEPTAGELIERVTNRAQGSYVFAEKK